MQRILLAAFMRGVGGGLALAATPYILAFGAMTLRAGVRGAGTVGSVGEDIGDCFRYFGELRGHRRKRSELKGEWFPEEDGYIVPE